MASRGTMEGVHDRWIESRSILKGILAPDGNVTTVDFW